MQRSTTEVVFSFKDLCPDPVEPDEHFAWTMTGSSSVVVPHMNDATKQLEYMIKVFWFWET